MIITNAASSGKICKTKYEYLFEFLLLSRKNILPKKNLLLVAFKMQKLPLTISV